MMYRNVTLLAAAFLCACATPSAPAPQLIAPAQWRAPAGQTDTGIDTEWWRSFGSLELDALIAQARRGNTDIAAAMARVRQADAAARIAGAALLPSLDGTASAARERQEERRGSRYSAGLSAGYEVDFWGRNRAGRDSAASRAAASAFERDVLQLSVDAAVATTWLQWVGLRERGALAALNLETARSLLSLVEARAEAGAAMPLELAQQRTLVAGRQRELAALRQQEAAAHTALGLLLGQSGDIDARAASLAELREPAPAVGLPATVLAQRPDISRAETLLRAADADIAAARAALWPSMSLSASAGAGGDRLRSLFNDPLYSLAAALTAPIFDGGRRAAQSDLAQARREELVADYHATVLSAFGDVEDALNAIAGLNAQTTAQTEELTQARRAFELAGLRYQAGSETLLTLLDAQRTLYAAEDTAAQLRVERLQAKVALCKALGGGWRQAEG